MKTQIKLIAISCLLSAICFSAFAQGTVFTYQGRVTDNGTNFTGAGQFKFALVISTNTSHGATATAILSGSFVTSYSLTYGGSGYVTAPAIHITGGGGSGATATATISGGVVTAINPGSAGSGYMSAPMVMIDPPPANIAYTTYWSNDGTSSAGSQPTAAVGVGVSNGLFMVVLGDTTLANMTAIPAALFIQPNLQLQIWFSDGVNGFAALSPLQNLTPAPYAAYAGLAGTASNVSGTVSAGQLSGTVLLTQLPAAVVTNNGTSINLGATPVLQIYGDNNSFVGPNAGNVTMTGHGNTANGSHALQANTTGSGNTANGWDTLLNNTSGSGNTADGSFALQQNMTGSYNTALGDAAMQSNTNGDANTAEGYGALNFNTSGSANTANGYKALNSNTTGGDNAAHGYAALSENTTGNYNTANGVFALYANTNGNYNSSVGYQSLGNNTSGSANSANGAFALNGNTSGNNNVANGVDALAYNTTGGNNVANGYGALYFNLTGNNNTANGFEALYYNTNGNNNIALGYNAGTAIVTGSYNIELGNAGQASDDHTIRIGDVQTDTYLAGTVHGNGGGLTGLNAAQLSGTANINISGSAASFTGSLAGDVTGPQSATVIAANAVDNGRLASDAASLNKVSGGVMTSAGGNVGIGTAGPQANLEVLRAANDGNPILRIGYNQTYFDFARDHDTGSLTIQGNQTGHNNIALVPTGGNVGIGTASPSTPLEVQGGPIKATGGLIIQTCSGQDPASPVTGQIWLRTDLP